MDEKAIIIFYGGSMFKQLMLAVASVSCMCYSMDTFESRQIGKPVRGLAAQSDCDQIQVVLDQKNRFGEWESWVYSVDYTKKDHSNPYSPKAFFLRFKGIVKCSNQMPCHKEITVGNFTFTAGDKEVVFCHKEQ